MENLEVYRGRFGESTAAFEPNLHRAATIEWRLNPNTVEQRPVSVEVDLSSRNRPTARLTLAYIRWWSEDC
jgi:hypothetical protein